ncbi:FAD/NAD(P)-binding protein [Nocardia sp. CDC159]|uniref:FAD/NAD(P)-binding protein n=1 Tax=Nocardia pulmonis TaxID=2951408 RepID=A0A9X2IVS6_9NOCA|nr:MULTISPECIES: FAD/NAD(P)-binding protein [Nocardia]MCM6773543.1 FAD/NAD(P)-binding protein [Nocardia pulmonis]MCM6786430.1 FAD/NAD(P)-binding protein [Nocardia sp. CDC159]
MRIGIVGGGPRGLSVFERICANARRGGERGGIEIYLVDSTRVGTGAVWRTDQSRQLLMNTVAAQVTIFTDESVTMDGPVEPGPSLFEWANFLVKIGGVAEVPEQVLAEARHLGPDTYPTRSFYGHYLRWAYERTRDRYARWVRAHELTATVIDLRDGPGGLQELVLDDGERIGDLHAVVLAQGHVPLRHSADASGIARAAEEFGLSYIAPGNAADVDLDRVPAHAPTIVRGLGLTFFDYMALLTVGRGGSFKESQAAGGLEYIASGREPLIVAGCRRGVPHHARGENQKGVDGRHVPTLLDSARIAALRERARRFGDVDFRRDVWPLVAREVEAVYYTRLISDRISPVEQRWFRRRYLDAPTARDTRILLAEYGIERDRWWNWSIIADPIGGRRFDDPAQFHRWLLDYLDADVRHARLGNVAGPVKSALDVLRDLRNEVRLIVDHGGITGSSYRDDLDGWYTPLNAFLSIGPPAERIAELAALIRADIVRIVGPGMRVRIEDGRFVTDSPLVAGSTVTASVLVDAWLPEPDLRTTGDALLRNLLRRGEIDGFAIADPGGDRYRTGGLTVAPDSHAIVDAAGVVHPRRFALGVPTESVHWVTAAGPRPCVDSVTLADSDRVARVILQRRD